VEHENQRVRNLNLSNDVETRESGTDDVKVVGAFTTHHTLSVLNLEKNKVRQLRNS